METDREKTPHGNTKEALAALQRYQLRNTIRSLNEAAHDAATQLTTIAPAWPTTERHALITAQEIIQNAKRNTEMIQAIIENTE